MLQMERSDNTFSSVFCQGGDCDSNTTLTNLADKSFIRPFHLQHFLLFSFHTNQTKIHFLNFSSIFSLGIKKP